MGYLLTEIPTAAAVLVRIGVGGGTASVSVRSGRVYGTDTGPNGSPCPSLKSAQSGFESQWGHSIRTGQGTIGRSSACGKAAHPGVTPAVGGRRAALAN